MELIVCSTVVGAIVIAAVVGGIVCIAKKKSRHKYQYRTLEESMRILSGTETGIL